jgi:hypothetical protein
LEIKNFGYIYFLKKKTTGKGHKYQDLVWNYGVKKYNDASNSMYHSVPEILKAEKQVVAGELYHIEVLMRESSCMKNEVG